MNEGCRDGCIYLETLRLLLILVIGFVPINYHLIEVRSLEFTHNSIDYTKIQDMSYLSGSGEDHRSIR